MGASIGTDMVCCQRSPNRQLINGLEIVISDYQASGTKAKVAEHLNRGQPVLLPLPSPLPYIIVAADPVMVNLVKGRPQDEAVSRLISSLAEIEFMLALQSPDARLLANTHLAEERMTVLLPVERKKSLILAKASMMMLHVITEDDENDEDDGMEVMRQISEVSVADGSSSCAFGDLAIARSESMAADLRFTVNGFPNVPFGQFLQVDHLEELCSQQRPLYGSWGNARLQPYAQSFDLVCAQFKTVQAPYSLLALDAEELRDLSCRHDPPSMSRINPDGTWKYMREGVNHGDLYGQKTRLWLTEDEWDAWLMR